MIAQLVVKFWGIATPFVLVRVVHSTLPWASYNATQLVKCVSNLLPLELIEIRAPSIIQISILTYSILELLFFTLCIITKSVKVAMLNLNWGRCSNVEASFSFSEAKRRKVLSAKKNLEIFNENDNYGKHNSSHTSEHFHTYLDTWFSDWYQYKSTDIYVLS